MSAIGIATYLSRDVIIHAAIESSDLSLIYEYVPGTYAYSRAEQSTQQGRGTAAVACIAELTRTQNTAQQQIREKHTAELTAPAWRSSSTPQTETLRRREGTPPS